MRRIPSIQMPQQGTHDWLRLFDSALYSKADCAALANQAVTVSLAVTEEEVSYTL